MQLSNQGGPWNRTSLVFGADDAEGDMDKAVEKLRQKLYPLPKWPRDVEPCKDKNIGRGVPNFYLAYAAAGTRLQWLYIPTDGGEVMSWQGPVCFSLAMLNPRLPTSPGLMSPFSPCYMCQH